MWTGRIPYGKCDIVPGEFFVATEFQVIAWLPIIPIKTWVIIEGSIQSFDDYVGSFRIGWKGRPIKFSVISFLLAWARTAIWLLIIGAGFYLAYVVLLWFAGRRPLIETVNGAAVMIAAFGLYRLSYLLFRAKPAREEYLRELLAQGFGEV